MKKLILAAALIASVATVKASSVSWGASTALDGSKVATGKMYLVGATDISAVNLAAFATMTSFSEASLAVAGFDRIYSSFDYSASKTSVTADKFNASDLGYSAGTVKAYAIVIGSGESQGNLAYSAQISFALNDASSPAQSKKSTASSFTYVEASKPGPEPIPEPTSAMLMLISLAGLALRRKQA